MNISVTVTETVDTNPAFHQERWLIVEHDLTPPTHCPTNHTQGIQHWCGAQVDSTYFIDKQIQYGSGIRYKFGFVQLSTDATSREIEAAKATVLANAEALVHEWHGDVFAELQDRAEDAAKEVRAGDLDQVFFDDTACIECDGEYVIAWAPHPCDQSGHIEAAVKI